MATILIVDDDPQFRALVRSVLESAGHKVLEAGTGKAALPLVQTGRPDLLVVDGLLPDTDGVAWIRKVRAEGIKIPIAFVSAFWRDLKSFQELTKTLDVALVLRKPVLPAAIGSQLEELLAKAAPAPVEVEVDDSPMAALEALRRDYLASLPEKLAALEIALAAYREAPTAKDRLEAARTQAHKLRGTAGSYGFLEVSEAAGWIEDALLGAAALRAPTVAEADQISRGLEQAMRGAGIQQPQPAASRGASPGATTGRVLVVDADERFLKMCVEAGRAQGLAVATARNRTEALAIAEVCNPDAALLDVHLDSPSFTLAAQLRKLPSGRGISLAFCSADDTLESRIAAAHAGGSLYLVKPLAPDQFGQAMRELSTQHRATAPSVLLVDDDAAFCARVAAVLDQEGMRVKTLTDPSGILEALDAHAPELVMLDVEMPGLSGFDLCRLMRTTPRWRTTPIIFLTAHPDVAKRLSAFEAGGDDYLIKPIVDPELVARLRVRLENTRLLRERAERDSLTGLLLRGPFVEQVVARLAEATRQGRPLGFALVDLDHFKQINDGAGHLAGDRVLAGLGDLLQRRFRIEDVRARWGGDEFALAFPGSAAEQAGAVVDRVRDEFSRLAIRSGKGDATLSASITAGVAAFPADGRTLEDLLGAADRRLYVAKSKGRNCVVSSGAPPVTSPTGPVPRK